VVPAPSSAPRPPAGPQYADGLVQAAISGGLGDLKPLPSWAMSDRSPNQARTKSAPPPTAQRPGSAAGAELPAVPCQQLRDEQDRLRIWPYVCVLGRPVTSRMTRSTLVRKPH
jgi:hypothetical protein